LLFTFDMTVHSLDKTLIFIVWCRLKTFEAAMKLIWTLNRLVPSKVHYMEKNPGMFS